MPDQNLFLRSLSPNLFELLRPRLQRRDLPAGTVLFMTGGKVNTVHFLQAGAVSLVSELRNGQMIESAMVGRDGLIGGGAVLDDRDAFYKAIVQVSASAFMLDVDFVRHIARDSEELRSAIIRNEQLILAQAQQSAACNAAHNLSERLSRWLLRVRDATGSDSFGLTQEFIAEMLGVGRTSVSLVAQTLQQAGLIKYRRGQITIQNVEGLQETACECYWAVKTHYDRLLSPVASSSKQMRNI